MSSTLSLTIKNGKVSRNTDTFGKMELYVKIKLEAGNQSSQQKTKVTVGGPNELIQWNQRLDFKIPRDRLNTAFLTVVVWDEDTTYDDEVGRGRVNLQNCRVFNGGLQSYQLNLFYENKEAGFLTFDSAFSQ